ncbi:acyl carrier protein 1, chloroplastic-like [Cucurbita pepo subsp. pepo]|uniref:acyl carrier protein 1, chloroplastic-like n=1 Tax=Cucurbita pepo subsp. pepo TaxID=3664 RepID=UPI000C9D8BDB|nr:acyl carrier protein 1, chloroplastic-like [Cucurbita pepo subsp. pepo]
MSSLALSPLLTTLASTTSISNCTAWRSRNSLFDRVSLFCEQRVFPSIQMAKPARGLYQLPTYFKSNISCSLAQPETMQVVQEIIAKQLSLEQSAVIPQTKFSELGADSLDTVEIMMALEEKFGVSIGEGGAEGISTVQDAADLIEKVKTSSAS